MALQVFALRPTEHASGKNDRKHVDIRVQIPSFQEFFRAPDAYLAKIPEEKRYNLYITLGEYQPGTRKTDSFISQDTILFDIDDIIHAERLSYLEVLKTVLKVDLKKCAAIFTGKGIHFLVRLQRPFTSKTYFEDNRHYYNFLCGQIDAALAADGLPGHADPAVFKHAVMVRMPWTERRKPIAGPFTDITKVELYSKKLEYCGFELKSAEADDTKTLMDEIKKAGHPDHKTIMQECLFLKECGTKEEKFTEPQWYASLGVTAFFNDENEASRMVSQRRHDYEPGQADKKAEQARKASGPRTCANIETTWGGCKSCPHYKKIKTPLQLQGPGHIGTEFLGFTSFTGNGRPKRHVEDMRKFFNRDYHYISIGDIKRVIAWNGTHYEPWDSIRLENFAHRHYSPALEESKCADEFVRAVRRTNYKSINEIKELTYKGLINMKNGVLDIKTGEVSPHDPKRIFQYCLPYAYDPDATAPVFSEFLRRITLGRAHLATTILEFMGYVLMGGAYEINKMLLLWGEGSNGKTSLIKIMTHIFGKENSVHLSMDNLKDKFTASLIEGKTVNFIDDEENECFRKTATWKKLTGDSTLMVQHKYEKGFAITNRAKLIMAMNGKPHLSETTVGLRRRLLVLPFDLNYEVNPEQLIEDLDAKLEAELPGIFNMAMNGAKTLLARGMKFLDIQESRDIVQEFVHDSDPVEEYWNLWVEKTGNLKHKVHMSDMFEHFQKEMERDKKIGTLSYIIFNKRVRVVAKRYGIAMKKVRQGDTILVGFDGIQLLSSHNVLRMKDNF